MGAVDGGAWGAAHVVRGFVAADEGCCGVCAHFFFGWLWRERWGFGGCGSGEERWGVGIYICGSFYLEGDGRMAAADGGFWKCPGEMFHGKPATGGLYVRLNIKHLLSVSE